MVVRKLQGSRGGCNLARDVEGPGHAWGCVVNFFWRSGAVHLDFLFLNKGDQRVCSNYRITPVNLLGNGWQSAEEEEEAQIQEVQYRFHPDFTTLGGCRTIISSARLWLSTAKVWEVSLMGTRRNIPIMCRWFCSPVKWLGWNPKLCVFSGMQQDGSSVWEERSWPGKAQEIFFEIFKKYVLKYFPIKDYG